VTDTAEKKYAGLPVQGYQSQPQSKVVIVNANKEVEERTLRILDTLKGLGPEHVDQRWLAIGRTKIEEAFMAINRAVFQPQRIELPPKAETMEEAIDRIKAYVDMDKPA
jgi:hypothetical protein